MCNVFFENSTRTRTTFEMAAQRPVRRRHQPQRVDQFNQQGETLLDTLHNPGSHGRRHVRGAPCDSGAAHFIAEHVCPHLAIISGGDGRHAHPTQGHARHADHPSPQRRLRNLSVAIVGDILHSRVARSNMLALKTLGCPDIRVIAPKTLLPIGIEQCGVTVYSDMAKGLKDVDVVIMLRLQRAHERRPAAQRGRVLPPVRPDRRRLKLAKPDALVMHPGPINRGVEIESAVADGPQSVILNQVTYGIAIRMAVLSMTMSGQNAQRQLNQDAEEQN